MNVEDVDGDGYLDVIFAGGLEANGSNKSHSLFLKRNSGYVMSELWLDNGMWSDIAGFADFDANGTIDVNLRSGNLHYLRNTAADGSAINVFMVDAAGAQNQHGRTVRATASSDSAFIMTRIVDGGSGYLSNNEYAVTFPTPKGDQYWLLSARRILYAKCRGICAKYVVQVPKYLILLPIPPCNFE